ncbi:hsp70 family protein [Gigaspora margarita]|uniref:Hsp70 family protein n=1 Tax=Gigaspora margarita TaxID=4874 RepID=A0A8H4EGM6_GIGMA|nr:hsp70 family protein [Gigaspora margarita]
MLLEKHYGHLSYMTQQFCERGEESEFRKYILDIEKVCPSLKQYVSGSILDELEEEDWEIEIDFETVKSFFDPVVNKILRLISAQLDAKLSSGFHSVKLQFQPYPMAAIERGAVGYGLDMDAVKNRVLKWTYGFDHNPKFQEGDPPSRKTSNRRIEKFRLMAKRGIQVEVNQRFYARMYPFDPDQTGMLFNFYYTAKKNCRVL